MSDPTTPARPLPLWLKAAGSAFALWHVFAVGLWALAARSGPWPAPPPMGVDQQVGPMFATSIATNVAFPTYLKPLRMTHNYHFASNEPAQNAVFLEVNLKNDAGAVIKTLKFPDDRANFWVRHRQSVLVRGLAEDQPLPPQITEKIAPAGQGPVLVEFWDMTEPGVLRLAKKPSNQVPTDRPVHHPSDAARVLAAAYVRHLCREHQAASAEIIRHHRTPVLPAFWFMPNDPPPDAFAEIKSYFGEYPSGK
jgi:hypothetical protein